MEDRAATREADVAVGANGDGHRYFVGVGAQKAGTTWLYHQLERHPDVAMPVKELHYFDSAFATRIGKSFGLRNVETVRQAMRLGQRGRALRVLERIDLAFRSPAEYRAALDAAAGPSTRVAGEITPAYSILTTSSFEIMRDTLRPKVVFIMRDPVDRLWSAVRFAHHGEHPGCALESIALQPDMAARGDYVATIESLEAVFPRDDILYLFFEELFQAATLRRVGEFLGVAQEWDWDLDRIRNASRPAKMPPVPHHIIDRLRPVYEGIHERFGDDVPASWRPI